VIVGPNPFPEAPSISGKLIKADYQKIIRAGRETTVSFEIKKHRAYTVASRNSAVWHKSAFDRVGFTPEPILHAGTMDIALPGRFSG